MNFSRVQNEFFDAQGVAAYAARYGAWRFLIIEDRGEWTTSYRLIDPKAPVSASSTIRGPFEAFSDAARAADEMLADLRKMA